MTLLKIFESLLVLPLDVVRDAMTLGGVLEDKDEANTVTRLKRIADHIDEVGR